ncbi:hypothetical protein [Burkholderia gladioli]|uniref:hypothetical protein n=1 Tax=Burkholderia gladioli TaxID=28095 RepID=UPI00163F0839|nr:hypothetical protein [Burkholderia gladioli]
MLTESQHEAMANADAHTTNAALPSYSALVAVISRLAYPDAGVLLTLDDYRNIARNLVQPDGVRVI